MIDEEQLTEEQIDARIAEKKAESKPRGRPKNASYLPWEEAREFVRGEMLPSRGKYFEWWDRNKPKTIPRFPYRVYTGENEWVSWNDFLGTNNKFNDKVGTKWRPFLEATGWALKLNLKSQGEWMEYCRIEDQLPKDIPARPDLVYDEWRSWGHWLGNRPVEAIQAKQEVAQKVQVFYIIHDPEHAAQNILRFGVDPAGLTSMKARWEDQQFTIVKLFWYDPAKSAIINQIVETFSRPYQGNTSERIVPNVWEIVYHLQMHLDQITSKDVQ
jgi:hypothetical protein